jgi:ketosteroid isomerase-like protein
MSMNEKAEHATKPSSQDEIDIQALIERWARAVREENREGIRADHDSEILMFDVPPPFLSRGLDAYMATWETSLSWSEKPVAFDFHDVEITAGKEVAFATATGRCAGVDPNGKREELQFRLTMGLRKIDGSGASFAAGGVAVVPSVFRK